MAQNTENKTASKVGKTHQFIKLLEAKARRDVPSLASDLGWLPHTVRAGLTRLKQKGYAFEKTKKGTPPRLHYRITAKPASHADAR